MATKSNRRYSIFVVRFKAAAKISPFSSHPNAETSGIAAPLCIRETRSAMKLAFSGASGETRENRTPIGQIGIKSIETIGPHRAITAGLAHVMHHDNVSMVSKEAGKGD